MEEVKEHFVGRGDLASPILMCYIRSNLIAQISAQSGLTPSQGFEIRAFGVRGGSEETMGGDLGR